MFRVLAPLCLISFLAGCQSYEVSYGSRPVLISTSDYHGDFAPRRQSWSRRSVSEVSYLRRYCTGYDAYGNAIRVIC